MGNVLTVRFYDRQGCEELYKNVDNNRVYVRQPANVDDIVFWYTSSKWREGYEADCHIKEGTIIRVVDKNGKEIFSEALETDNWNGGTSAKKNHLFLDEELKEIVKIIEAGGDLSPHHEWRAWLLEQKKEHGYKGYDDNWLYSESWGQSEKILHKFERFDVTFEIVMQTRFHTICGKTWSCIFIYNKKDKYCEQICGYYLDSKSKTRFTDAVDTTFMYKI